MSAAFHSEISRRSWGRVVSAEHDVARPATAAEVVDCLSCVAGEGGTALPYGLGRSYGDSNLNAGGALIEGRRLDRFIAFDRTTGILRAEAGVSLDEIIRLVVPHGYFIPTTPGTRYVTLGGAIANDVHGKNHHRAGPFGRHVRALRLARSDGEIREIGPGSEPDLFAATIGGLGLTGMILDAEISLVPIASAMIDQRTEALRNLDHFFELAEARADEYEHTVAWIDCTASGDRLGQGIFSSGDWAPAGGLKAHRAGAGPALPVDLPGFALNSVTLRSFNWAYRQRQLMKPERERVHYAGFFHPLDTIRSWNRLYGAQGFYQYQSVIAFDAARDATRAMLERISASGQGSFLAVLKTFGDLPSPGAMSFPMPGVTLALDFANRGEATLRLMGELDAIVREAGGRLYPAKDGRMPAELYRASYPGWEMVERHRDPAIMSSFWRRVIE